jgi:hypothetical protein
LSGVEIGSHTLDLLSCLISKLFRPLDNPKIFREPSLEIIDHRRGTRRQWALLRANEPVIPAKAGIQSDDSAFPKVRGVDSRFRGNDQVSQMTPKSSELN